MTIFDFINSEEIASYWVNLTQGDPPYLGEVLYPSEQKLGLDIKWIKGKNGLPVAIKASAFDSKAIPRERLGFDQYITQMPFFKESMYIDEELRQELVKVLESGSQKYIDIILGNIFADTVNLLKAAAVRREAMRMQALTTGAISVESNGQSYTYDYGLEHKEDVVKPWADLDADVINDIRLAKEQIQDENGETLTRAVCRSQTWRYIRENEKIKKDLFVMSDGDMGALSDKKLQAYLSEELELTVQVYDKRYVSKDGDGTSKTIPFVPEDTFIMLPDGPLGTGWHGTTPEQIDLISSDAANVSIVDSGVAITTSEEVDPVTVNTKVTQIFLPSFEQADKVFIYDVNP